MWPSPVTRSGNSPARVDPWAPMPEASALTILRPGATRSGLAKPSCVTPRLLIGHRLSSEGDVVPLSSRQPTVMTSGSLPGAYHTASWADPRLPADATTVTPRVHRRSTAASTGLVA